MTNVVTSAQEKIPFANTLRGWAALSVIIAHYLGAFWTMRPAVEYMAKVSLPSEKVLPTPLYIKYFWPVEWFDWGSFGVALFFLISGFVIPFSVKKYNPLSFLKARAYRILPVYITGFSLTLISLFFSTQYFLDQKFPYKVPQVLLHYFPGIRDVIGIPNIDGIIWTLEIEVKFYLIFFLFFNFFRKRSFLVFLIPVLLSLSVFIIYFFYTQTGFHIIQKIASPFTFLSIFIVFMFIGVSFNYYYQKKEDLIKIIFISVSLFFLFYASWNYNFKNGLTYGVPSYAVALCVFSFFMLLKPNFSGGVIINFFSKISYPLYVIHAVCGYVILSVLIDFNFSPMLSLILTTAFIIYLSLLIHKFIEVPYLLKGKSYASVKEE